MNQPVQTIVGIDYGHKRVGVAVGNTLTRHAEPLEIISHNHNTEQVIRRITQIIKEWQAHAIALGIPSHPDGTAHAMTEACVDFQTQLSHTLSIPVYSVDERYSSSVLSNRVHTNARGQIRAQAQDDQAAAVILQQYLDAL